jgi:hypothetical protein
MMSPNTRRELALICLLMTGVAALAGMAVGMSRNLTDPGPWFVWAGEVGICALLAVIARAGVASRRARAARWLPAILFAALAFGDFVAGAPSSLLAALATVVVTQVIDALKGAVTLAPASPVGLE